MEMSILRQAKAQLSRFLEALLGRIRLIQPCMQPRQAGLLKGKITIADNFDEYDEELDEMFTGPLFPEE